MAEKEKLHFETQLWDGIKQVYDRYEEGKKTLTDMIKFYTDRAMSDEHYARDLQKLVGKPALTTEMRTLGKAWTQMKADHENMQRIRMNLAQSIMRDVVGELKNFKAEQSKQKDQISATVAQLDKEMTRLKKSLNATKTGYHQKSETAENAALSYDKAQKDPQFPPKTLTKLNTRQQQCKKEAEQADQLYQQTVQEFQTFQVKYEEQMKAILKEFQQMEEKRVVFVAEIVKKYLVAQDQLLTEATAANKALHTVAESIDGMQDIQDFILENKTGLSPPPPVEYMPYKGQATTAVPAATAVPAGKKPAAVPAAAPPKAAASSVFGRSKSKSKNNLTAEKTTPPPKVASSGNLKGPSSPAASTTPPPGATPPAVVARTPSSSSAGLKANRQSGPPSAMTGLAAAAAAKAGGRASSALSSSAGAPPPPSQSESKKRARALYDYSAADDTEITFDVGEIIDVYKQDDSGWWDGECRGKRGIFPGNYCELIDEGVVPASQGGIKRVKATFDFVGENEDELTIREGDVITIESETEGWYHGVNERGESGLFPANFCKDI